MEMVLCHVPQGTFRMGQGGKRGPEEPVHRVVLSEDYWLGKYPVTKEQFGLFKENHKKDFDGNPRNPAEDVNWEEAREFCDWFGEAYGSEITCELKRLGVTSTSPVHVRIPTEAEWEYACRAATGKKGKLVITETDYWNGDGEAALAEVGWFDGNSDGKTHPVGGKPGNGFGLHDMHGNVWEWCLDAWDGAAYRKRTDEAENPFVPGSEDAGRVRRGGSWGITAWRCRSACRGWWGPGFRSWLQGFRLGLFPGPVPCPFGEQQQAEPTSGGGNEGTEWKPEEAGGASGDDFAKLSGPRPPEDNDEVKS